MKKTSWLFVAFLLFWAPAPVIGDAVEQDAAPAAVFPETAYSFEPVVSGTQVTHTYPVRNTGSAVLEIQRVDTG